MHDSSCFGNKNKTGEPKEDAESKVQPRPANDNEPLTFHEKLSLMPEYMGLGTLLSPLGWK